MSLTNYRYGISSMGVPFDSGTNPFGTTYFVTASGGSDNNDGLDANHPFATIQKAIDTYAAGDTVILSPGTHSVDVSTASLVPLADTQFRAAIPPMGGKPSTIITHDADDGIVLVTLDVDGCGFYGIEFLMVAGGTTAVDLFDISQTTAVNGLTFEDCWFNLNSVDKAGVVRAIAVDDGTNATTGMVIRNCRFLGGDATTGAANYIVTGVGGIPDAVIEDNIFVLESADADAVGIVFPETTVADKNYGMAIRNNDFIGPKDYGMDAVGIVHSGTELDSVGIIRSNYFAYCAAASITADKINKGIINNYYGDTTTGGTLVDPGT
jgi:hypothetical protein